MVKAAIECPMPHTKEMTIPNENTFVTGLTRRVRIRSKTASRKNGSGADTSWSQINPVDHSLGCPRTPDKELSNIHKAIPNIRFPHPHSQENNYATSS